MGIECQRDKMNTLRSRVKDGLISLVVLTNLFLTTPSAPADYEEVYRLRREGKILPLSTIIARGQAIHRGRLLEAEIERSHGRYIYEIVIGGENGRFYELYFDATTGELLKAGQKN
jgi:uncharacterized membrane protein YkoI